MSKSFGGVQAVNRVSLDVNEGDLLSVIGPNGAGKTTLLNMISGFYHPDSGQISLGGDDVTHIAPVQGGRARGGPHLPEHRALPGHDGARQPHARTPRAHEDRRAGRLRLLGPRPEGGGRPPRRVEDIIDFLRIQDLRRRPTGSLAYGLQKRVELGPGAGARSQDPAARRADGRLQPRGEGRHGALHPRRERGVGHDHHPDRARHGRGDGHLRPGGGARHGHQDRRRHARRGPRQSPGDQGLPGRCQARANSGGRRG